MSHTLTKTCVLVVFLFINHLSAQSISYVDKNATAGNNNGSSWEHAFTDLQSALTATPAPDEIWVAEGIYKPTTGSNRSVSFQLKSGVALYGGFSGGEMSLNERNADAASNNTILSGDLLGDDGAGFTNRGDNTYQVVNGTGVNNTAILDGFTIRGGSASGPSGTRDHLGGGLICDFSGSPTIRNVTITDNEAVLVGGAAYINGSTANPTFINVIFSQNRTSPATISGVAGEGGAIYFNSSPSSQFINCIFQGNHGEGKGGAISLHVSSPSFINCTFAGNRTNDQGGAIYSVSSSHAQLTNCILWDNHWPGNKFIYQNTAFISVNSTITYTNCIVQFAFQGSPETWNTLIGTDGGNNSEADPLFHIPADPSNAPNTVGDFRLKFDSPGINTGDESVDATDTDVSGNPRIFVEEGGRIDMGAYERSGSIVTYVDAAATGNNDGSSWENAFVQIPTSLAQYPGDEVWVAQGVYAPGGSPFSSFTLINNVAFYGGFVGNETAREQRSSDASLTILSGDVDNNDINADGNHIIENVTDIMGTNAYHVITCGGVSPATILDGFTITAGSATADTGDDKDDGGGLLNDGGSPTISNCIFQGNEALSRGGAIFSLGSTGSTLSQVLFVGNEAVTGGAVNEFNSSSISASRYLSCGFYGNSGSFGGALYLLNRDVTFKNTVFSGNTSPTSVGGALYIASGSFDILGCTFTGNTANANGAAMYNQASQDVSVHNSIFWNNAAGGLLSTVATYGDTTSASTAFSHCVFENSGGSSAWSVSRAVDLGGNVDIDPQFIDADGVDNIIGTLDDNPSLGKDSLLAALGDNQFVAVEDVEDFAGNPRIIGQTVDIGAYESKKLDIQEAPANIHLEIIPDGTAITIEDWFPAISNLNVETGLTYTFEITPLTGNLAFDIPPTVNAEGNLVLTPNESSLGTAEIVVTIVDSNGIYGSAVSLPAVITSAAGKIIYVNASASSNGDGTSWGTAYRELRSGLQSAEATDEVWVAQGTYYPDKATNNDGINLFEDNPTLVFELSPGVEIYGGFTGVETRRSQREPFKNKSILSGDIDENDVDGAITGVNAYTIVRTFAVGVDTARPRLDGFTMTGGSATGSFSASLTTGVGGAIYLGSGSVDPFNIIISKSNAVFANCIIINNNAFSGGGGVYLGRYAEAEFINCQFIANEAQLIENGAALVLGSGGAVRLAGASARFTNCVFSGNRAGEHGGAIAASPEAFHITDVYLNNCTFSGNHAEVEGGCIYANTGGAGFQAFNVDAANSIFWNNSDETGVDTKSATISGVKPLNTNFYQSIVANAFAGGSWNTAYGVDFGGINRDIDPRFIEPVDPATAPTAEGDLRLQGISPAIDAGDINSFFYEIVEASDAGGNPREYGSDIDLGAFELGPPSSIIYVNQANTGAQTGESWEYAFTYLQDALLRASELDVEIWMAAGTYYPDDGLVQTQGDSSSSFSIFHASDTDRTVKIYGGFAATATSINERNPVANSTILSGDIDHNDNDSDGNGITDSFDSIAGTNAGPVIIASGGTHSQLELYDLVITAGDNTSSGGGIRSFEQIYVSGCTIAGNRSGGDGGGLIVFNQEAEFLDTVFLGNQANRGGGLHAPFAPTLITNCLFVDNESTQNVGGGGVFVGSGDDTTITNTTFLGNTATSAGGVAGVYNFTGTTTINNSVFWNNNRVTTVTSTASIAGSTPQVNYSFVQGLNYGGTNLDSSIDPLLDAEGIPLEGSPLINAGNSSLNNSIFDLIGNNRKVGQIDMGAYENGSVVGVDSNEFWKTTQTASNGWLQSSWFSWLNNTHSPWIYHLDHDWMYITEGESGGMWFWQSSLGWSWSDEQIYPWMWSDDKNAWLFYYIDSETPRWFYNSSTMVWESD